MAKAEIVYSAAALEAISGIAPLEKITGATAGTDVLVRAYDDTTDEFANGKFQIPGDVDTGGTVTFRVYVMSKTVAASRNIGITFGHIALNDSEDFDVAYTDVASTAKAIDATQDNVTETTFTETVSNLSWAANDMVYFRVSRDNTVATNLVGDMYLHLFAVEIPLT